MTETARAQEINDLIRETVCGPRGELLTPECANAWEVANLIASLQIRVEALEDAENYRQQDQDAERAAEPAPASSLAERVANTLATCDTGDDMSDWDPEACAVILAVAAWLRDRGFAWVAQTLEKEVKR